MYNAENLTPVQQCQGGPRDVIGLWGSDFIGDEPTDEMIIQWCYWEMMGTGGEA